MKRYDEMWLTPHQHENIFLRRPRHVYGLEDRREIIQRPVTYYVDPEDMREDWWGKIDGKGVLVVVSAGALDTVSYGAIVTPMRKISRAGGSPEIGPLVKVDGVDSTRFAGRSRQE